MIKPCSVVESLWTLQAQYETWLEVEKAVARVQGEQGIIPATAADAIQQTSFSLEGCLHYEGEMHHDLNAFLRNVSDFLHPAVAKFVHYGLTSSDVVDTALALRLARCMDHFIELCDHKSAYPWPEAMKLLRRAWGEIAVGKLSGPVGTHATFPPEIEDLVLKSLGLRTELISTQIVARDHHAAWVLALTGIALNFGDHISAAPLMIALENVALWHERDISHSSAERVYLPEFCAHIDQILHAGKRRFT